MTQKKIYTREEFEELRLTDAKRMGEDKELFKDAIDVKVRAGKYHWVHQTNWFGEPILQLPQDVLALQEIIFNTRPKYIIEVGTAWSGTLLFYSTLMEVLGGEKIIGIDIYIPDDLRQRISSFEKLAKRIEYINGSSIDDTTVDKVKSIIGDCRDILIVLDSDHTHKHVLAELRKYGPLVGKGSYLVVSDTVVEYQPKDLNRPRDWGPGDNPKTALDEYMKECDRFEVDQALSDKLLMSCVPGGYLKCVKD